MAYKLYQKLISAMANEGVCNASDVDMSASVNGQSYSKVSTIINAIISFVTSLVSTGLKREIVQALPTTNISDTTIYLMLKDPAGASGDIYDEYMYINNNWEHIGSTEVDLSGYATESYVSDGYIQKVALMNLQAGKPYWVKGNSLELANANILPFSSSITALSSYTNVTSVIEGLYSLLPTTAADITYSGDITSASNVKDAIDTLRDDVLLDIGGLDANITAIQNTLSGLHYPLRLVGAISNSANSTLISEINSEAIGGTGSNFRNIEVGQAYYYAKDETSTINGHNIPTGSGVIAQGDVIICLVKSNSDINNATGYHTEWLAVNGNITQAQLSALIENQLEGVVDAYNYWVDNIKPAGTAATLENYVAWLREPSVTAAQSALDAVAELTDLSGQWIELTKAQYTACDNNTDKTAIPWTAIDNTLPYLHENFKYIITDQSEEAALTAIINSLFVKCTRSEYEALVSAGTVNPNAYYLIAEETSNN